MLWVEQPVGTGFSIGEVTATSEEEIAQDFIKFFKNFQVLFGIKKFKIYVSGESYAGRYVPYISAAMLDAKDKNYYDVQGKPYCRSVNLGRANYCNEGALVYDPVIGQFVYAQEEVPIVPFVQANNNMFGFNQSFLAELESLDKSCGYAAYREKYFTFPASGVQPPVYFNYTSQAACDVFSMVDQFAFETNPCFDVYEINQQWRVPSFLPQRQLGLVANKRCQSTSMGRPQLRYPTRLHPRWCRHLLQPRRRQKSHACPCIRHLGRMLRQTCSHRGRRARTRRRRFFRRPHPKGPPPSHRGYQPRPRQQRRL